MTATETLATALIATSTLTTALLLVTIRQRNTISDLRTKVTVTQIALQKRWNTIDEQAKMLGELQDRNERLHADMRRMWERLPSVAVDGICGDEAPTLIGFTTMHPVCILSHGHASEWHEGDTGSRWKHTGQVDEDVTRAYIPPIEWDTALGSYAPKPEAGGER